MSHAPLPVYVPLEMFTTVSWDLQEPESHQCVLLPSRTAHSQCRPPPPSAKFINLATQSDQKLAVTHSIKSCTDSIEQADPFYIGDRRVILYDTPGFDNTAHSEDEILRIIALGLKNL